MTDFRYDPKCEDLSKYFLEDEAALNTTMNARLLAQDIQDAIEAWFHEREEPDA